jgi:hypothetical protein
MARTQTGTLISRQMLRQTSRNLQRMRHLIREHKAGQLAPSGVLRLEKLAAWFKRRWGEKPSGRPQWSQAEEREFREGLQKARAQWRGAKRMVKDLYHKVGMKLPPGFRSMSI